MNRKVSALVLFCLICFYGTLSSHEVHAKDGMDDDRSSFSHDGIRIVLKSIEGPNQYQKGYIDEEGNVILAPGDYELSEFRNGLGLVLDLKSMKSKVINTKGEVVTEFSDYVSYFDGERGVAGKKIGEEYQWAIIDAEGEAITPFKYSELFVNLPYDKAIIASLNQKVGVINWDDSVKLPIEYNQIFMHDSCPNIWYTVKEGKFGAIWDDGNQILPCIYDHLVPFSEGFAMVSLGERYAIVNESGELITPFEYDYIEPFKHGSAKAVKAGNEVVLGHPTKKSRNINIFVNNEWLYTDQAPIIESGRTLVPIRAIAEATGYWVTWNPSSKIITLQDEIKIISLHIGQNEVTINTFDDHLPPEKMFLDVVPKIIDGRAYVPLRFLLEATDADVFWNDVEKSIYITSH